MTSEHYIDLLFVCGFFGLVLALVCLLADPPPTAVSWTLGWFLGFWLGLAIIMYALIVLGVWTVMPFVGLFG